MKLIEKEVVENPWADFYKNQKKYSTPKTGKSIWQIVNTFVPYLVLWILMVYSLTISYWLTAFLILLSAGFLVRLFIIFHDCGHGSFFKSDKANKVVGTLIGVLTFTPYYKWHSAHIKHHANVGNLDKRGDGDIWILTKEEYDKSSTVNQFFYRVYRNPVFMFGIGPMFVFLVQHRLTKKGMSKKEKRNVHFTNISLVVLFFSMSMVIGFVPFLILQLIIVYLSAVAGLWLFYLQHQYEDVSWYRNKEWNFREVALEGSSYVKFPKLLQWFSGNIGFHHIHHINARIPNYNLEKCYQENPVFQEVKPVDFLMSLKSLKLRLWDEKLQKLVAYKRR